MADVSFEWDREGASALLESTGPLLLSKAKAVASAAARSGGSYVADLERGSHSPRMFRNNVYAAVTTADARAMAESSRGGVLLKALASGRG